MWRPGASAPAAADLEREDGEFAVLNAASNKRLPIARQRQLLPIYAQRTALLHAVETHRTVVVVGETGSGKTTQLPQYLHEAGWTAGGRRVVCTQPRRIAAVSLAERIAAERAEQCGVGDALVQLLGPLEGGLRVQGDERPQLRVAPLAHGQEMPGGIHGGDLPAGEGVAELQCGQAIQNGWAGLRGHVGRSIPVVHPPTVTSAAEGC